MGTAPPTGTTAAGDTGPQSVPSSAWNLHAAQLSDVGRVRSENQDACGAFHDSAGWRLFVVADGMGGHRGGATASRMCVETLGREFQSSQAPVRERLIAGLVQANRAIRALAEEQPDLGGMGTTAVVLALAPAAEGWIAWVGDSRAYRLRDGRLEALTEDHSLVAEWVRLAVIRPEEAANHPRRNELLRSVGPLEQIQVDVEPLDVLQGDRFLLCSDGLWGEVSDPEMAAVLGFEAPQAAVTKLVELANSRGAPDNVTVQIAAVGDLLQPTRPVARPLVEEPRARERRPLALAAGAALVGLALVGLLWFAATRGPVAPESAAPGAVIAEVEPEEIEPPVAEAEPPPPPEPVIEVAPAPDPPPEPPPEPVPAVPEAPPSPPVAEATPPAPLEPPPPPAPEPEPEPVAPAPPAPAPTAAAKPTPAPTPTAAPAARPSPREALVPVPPPRASEQRQMAAHDQPFSDVPPGTDLASSGSVARSALSDEDAKVRAFLEEWARAIRARDYAAYQRLGFPASRVEFEARYPAQTGAQVDLALLDHESPKPSEHRVRVKLAYAFDSGSGMRRLTDEQAIVLRERFGVLRYASRWR